MAAMTREEYLDECLTEIGTARDEQVDARGTLDPDREARARQAVRRAAVQLQVALAPFCPQPDATTAYEAVAAAFYAATGMLAPGKDDGSGCHSYEARLEAWAQWTATR